jgi:hypothetical protein
MSIESTVIGFLADRLEVPVSGEVPPGPQKRYVVVERTGGGDEKDGMRRVTLAIRSCAKEDLSAASRLSARVRSVMRRLPELPRVFRCECTREYNFTDIRSKERRYQAVFEILYMEEDE